AHNGAWFSYECAAVIKEQRSLSEPSALRSERPDRRLFKSATWKSPLLVSSRVGPPFCNACLSSSNHRRLQKIHLIVRTGGDRETRARKRWHQGGAPPGNGRYHNSLGSIARRRHRRLPRIHWYDRRRNLE